MEHKYFDINTYNRIICQDTAAAIQASDQQYQNTLLQIAAEIRDHREAKPIILLSGPSGSGKTTTAGFIAQILNDWGYPTHTLSMDNYFVPMTDSDRRLLANGKLDLESPNRLNTALLNQQLSQMIACQPVKLPRYDFVTSLPVDSGITLTRKPGELIILEGIHALNPEVITIPDAQTAKIYISVRTRVQDGDLILHPSMVRLLRRMIRDSIFRDRAPQTTIQFYDSVERGEEKYIMPYKYRSTYDVDTFIDYELSVIKTLLPELANLPDAEKQKAAPLLQVLEDIAPIDPAWVPKNALLREFIGDTL